MCVQALMISILNPIYEKWISRIDQKSRELIVGFIFVLLALYFPLCHSGCLQYLIYTETQRQIFAAIMIFGAALFSMQAPLERVRWNKWIMVPMWLGGLGLLFTRILHPIGSGYAVFGVMLLTVYPCLYFVWINRGDIERLFDIISWVNVLVGVCYIAYSTALLRVYPWEVVVAGRVRGTFYNSNLYSMIGMAIACCALYLLYRVWGQKAKQRFLLIAFVIGFIVAVAGQSRASILVVAGSVAIVLIFAAKCGRISKRIVKSVIAVCCIFVIGGGLFAVLHGGSVLPASEDGSRVSVIERFIPEGKDFNSYSSGRIGIWAFYAENLNLLGNDFDLADINARFGVGHAHNNFLEYGYRCGVIVAGVFILAGLIAGLFSLQGLFSKWKSRDYLLFCVIFVFAYFIESVVDVATIPMERYAPYFYYLLLAGMAGRKDSGAGDLPAPDSSPHELRIP